MARSIGTEVMRLYASQEAELQYLLRNPRALLLSEMGTGKTPALLAYAAEILGRRGTVLWLTEKGLVPQLLEEAAKWLPEGIPQPVEYGTNRRTSHTDRFFYTTHGIAAGQYKQWGARIGLLIVDEAALFASIASSPKAPVTYSAMHELAGRSQRSVFATGTPVQTAHGLDLMALLEVARCIDGETRSAYLREVEYTTRPDADGKTLEIACAVTPAGADLLADALSKVAVRARVSDMEARAKVPAAVQYEIPVQLTGEALAQYQQASNLVGLERYHAQLAASRSVEDLVPAAVECLLRGRGAKHKHAVVFTENYDLYKPIRTALKDAGVPVFEINGEMSAEHRNLSVGLHREQGGALLGTSAIETGLNLQYAGLLVTVSPTWNHTRESQREARLVRPESAHEVVEHITIMPDVELEARKAGRRDEKEALAERILSVVPNPLKLEVNA